MSTATTAKRFTAPNQHYILTLPNDTKVKLEQASDGKSAGVFRATEITARDGYKQTITRDAVGFITGVSDSLGRALVFTWVNGQLTKITAPGGIEVAYTYDYAVQHNGINDESSKRLLTATVSSGGVSETTTYHYENASYPFHLTGITDARGIRYKTVTYDAAGRAVESVDTPLADARDLGIDLGTLPLELEEAGLGVGLGRVDELAQDLEDRHEARLGADERARTEPGEPSERQLGSGHEVRPARPRRPCSISGASRSGPRPSRRGSCRHRG